MFFARRNFQQAPPPVEPGWRTEFGPTHQPPQWVLSLLQHGILEDRSWRNDLGASFVLPGREQDLYIWVDHLNPEQRTTAEYTDNMRFLGADPRYMLTLGSHEHNEQVTLWKGDDEDEMRDVFFAKRFELGF